MVSTHSSFSKKNINIKLLEEGILYTTAFQLNNLEMLPKKKQIF